MKIQHHYNSSDFGQVFPRLKTRHSCRPFDPWQTPYARHNWTEKLIRGTDYFQQLINTSLIVGKSIVKFPSQATVY
jgi:hypothetical protein